MGSKWSHSDNHWQDSVFSRSFIALIRLNLSWTDLQIYARLRNGLHTPFGIALNRQSDQLAPLLQIYIGAIRVNERTMENDSLSGRFRCSAL